MSSSGAPRFGLAEGGAAAGGEEHERLLHLHHHHQPHRQQGTHHVPQHSRREKLRFAPEGFPPPARPVNLVQRHHPAAAASSSPWSFYNDGSCHAPLAASAAAVMPGTATQFVNHTINPVASPSERQTLQQHNFSLSLLSATPSPVTPSPVTPPRRPQPQQQYSVRPAHPLGPFTGYAAVLNRSRFLEPAQRLLEELCGVVSHGGVGGRHAAGRGMALDADLMDGSSSDRPWNGSFAGEAERLNPSAGQKQCWRSNKLVCILDEVYKRYKQYYQQAHDVITSFECVAGLGTAAPYAFMALKVMSKNFGSLKNMILDQLRHMNMALEKGRDNDQDISGFKIVNDSSCLRRSTNNSRSTNQPQLWRPQRGLPEPAVSVLRAWLFEHFLHPYPTDSDKQMLAKQTGLTRNQVSNWFINARVRLWKPMVEEVHSLESQQKHKSWAPVKHSNTDEKFQQPPMKISRIDRNHDITSKSIQQEVPLMPNNMPEHLNMAFDDLSDHQDVGFGTGTGAGTGTSVESNGVSLTLGLHQNNNVAHFAEQLPVNVARQYGLDECLDSYPYAEQGLSFGKNACSHLFRDLVG